MLHTPEPASQVGGSQRRASSAVSVVATTANSKGISLSINKMTSNHPGFWVNLLSLMFPPILLVYFLSLFCFVRLHL